MVKSFEFMCESIMSPIFAAAIRKKNRIRNQIRSITTLTSSAYAHQTRFFTVQIAFNSQKVAPLQKTLPVLQ